MKEGRIVGRPFQKGQSGNPGGRPREMREVVELARAYGPEAINALAGVMRDSGSPQAARVAAANAILDRAYGKPKEMKEVEVSHAKTRLLAIEKLTDEQLDALEIALRETVLKLESPDEGDVIEGKVESEELNLRSTSRLIAPRRAN